MKSINEAAKEYCKQELSDYDSLLKHDLVTRAFIRGAELERKRSEILLEALEYIAKTDISSDPPDTLWLNNWRNSRKMEAQTTLQKYKEGETNGTE